MITKKTISEFGQILLGILLTSIGLKAFLLPNGFLDGGLTGIALLGNALFGINVSLLLIFLSIPFMILAYFKLAKRIMYKSLFSILLLAVSVELETFQSVTDDKLLIAIFGGIFVGLGLGFTIKNGAVLDGSEIVGILLNERFGISMGQFIISINVVLFSFAAYILSIEAALYSILTFIVTAKISDFVIGGIEEFIGVMIVSRHYEAMEKAIFEQLGAGMTIYQGKKGIGSSGQLENMNIIHTVINRIDIRKIHQIASSVDPEVFLMEFDVNKVQGGVLRRYLDNESNKKLAPVGEKK